MLRLAARSLSPTEVQSDLIQGLILGMCETMRATPGVGLAAPQIGESIQLVVIEDREEYHKDLLPEFLVEAGRVPVPFHVLINPRLVSASEEKAEFFEGCLSLSGFRAVVPRSLSVRVEALDEKGDPVSIAARGWYARILQHEIDHLQGTLYIDRMRSRTLTNADNFNRYWKAVPMSELTKG